MIEMGTKSPHLFCGQYSQRASRFSWKTREIFSRDPSHFRSVTTCFFAMGEAATSDEAAVWVKALGSQ
jgi:hypothetical protein